MHQNWTRPPLHHLPTLHRGSCTVLHTLGLEPTTSAEKGCHANHYTALCLVHYKSIHIYIHITQPYFGVGSEMAFAVLRDVY